MDWTKSIHQLRNAFLICFHPWTNYSCHYCVHLWTVGASLTSGEDARYHKESPQGIQASAGGWFSDSDDHCTAAPLHRHTHKKAKQHQWRHLRVSGGNLDYRRRQGCVCPLIDSWLHDMVWSFAEILTQSFTRRTVRRKKERETRWQHTSLSPRFVSASRSPWLIATKSRRDGEEEKKIPLPTCLRGASCCHTAKHKINPDRVKTRLLSC